MARRSTTAISSIDEFFDMINWEKSSLESVGSEVQLIGRELLSMKKFLENGTVEADGVEVQRWQELLQILHDAEAAIANYVHGTASLGMEEPHLKRFSCRKDSVVEEFSKETSQILGRIEELKVSFEKSSNHLYSPYFDSGSNSVNLSDWIRSPDDIGEAGKDTTTSAVVVVVGLSTDRASLKQWLLLVNPPPTQGRRVISIIGIQGIGKTTLAWEIFKNRCVTQHFQCKAWVCASARDNVVDLIVKDIQKQIDGFSESKRYLIVIDNIENLQVWTELRDKIPHGGSGSTIVITTRDAGVACSADYSHRLKVLSKVESWELFKKKLSIAPWRFGNAIDDQVNTEKSLDDLGQEMVEKCGGIPYLIVELANRLSTVDPNAIEWSSILHGTDTHFSHERQPWCNLSYSLLEMLPLHVKNFLHIFSTMKKIPERRLILIWAVEGGFWEYQRNDGICDNEAAAMRWQWIQDLLDLNLIQAVKRNSLGVSKAYCIPLDHPLLQILNARGAHGSSYDDYNGGKVCIHRIADRCNNVDLHSRHIHASTDSPLELEPYKFLHSLWCFNYPVGYKPGQQLAGFLGRCINNNCLWLLRVVDLERVHRPNLPEEIGKLIKLRYLGLRWTFLDTLPSSISNLQNLQALDLKHTNVTRYPEIWKMHKLQHLYLNERYQSEFVTQLSFLSDLQTLSGINIVDDFSPVKDGLDRLKKLRKLRLTCKLDWEQKREMVECIGELECLQTLKLTSKGDKVKMLESLSSLWRNKHVSCMHLQGLWGNLYQYGDLSRSNLTTLTLSLTQLGSDPMPVLKNLPKLRLLRLFSKSFTGISMHCKSGGFLELRVLKIWRLELQEWTVDDGAMPKLEKLEIRACQSLEVLPNLPKTLSELKLTEMPKEFTNNVMGRDSEKVAHVSSVIIQDWLGSHTSIELYSGKKSDFQERLEKFFDLHEVTANLKKLILSETKLKQDPMPDLEKLPQLEVLILSSKSFMGERMLCSQGGFRKLKQLTIRELEELKELTVEGAMPEVEGLEIKSCKNLNVPTQMPESLKKLKLVGMPKDFAEKLKGKTRVAVEAD